MLQFAIATAKGFFTFVVHEGLWSHSAYCMQRESSRTLLLIKRRKSGCNNYLHSDKAVFPSVFTAVQCWNNLYVSENCVVPPPRLISNRRLGLLHCWCLAERTKTKTSWTGKKACLLMLIQKGSTKCKVNETSGIPVWMSRPSKRET